MKAVFQTLARLAAAAVILGLSHDAMACAACFGKSDSKLAVGMNWGIMSLLFVVLCVLSTIASFFVFLARRSSGAETASMPDGTQPDPSSKI